MLFFIEENAGDNMNEELLEIVKDMEMDEYVKYMIDNNFIKKDLTPIKCTKCYSTNLEERDPIVGGWNIPDGVLCEVDMVCKDCNHVVAHWAYGSWDL